MIRVIIMNRENNMDIDEKTNKTKKKLPVYEKINSCIKYLQYHGPLYIEKAREREKKKN